MMMNVWETNKHRNILLVGAIFQVMFTISAALALGIFLSTIMHAHSSANWPLTTGKVVVGSNSKQLGDQTGVGSIWYEYQIGNKSYRSDRVTFFEQNGVLQHKEGDVVDVFYNPSDYSDSCLVRGVSLGASLRLSAYVLSFVIAVCVLFQLLYARFSQKANEKDYTSKMFAMTAIIRGLFHRF
jgi:hypothetical protein